MDVKILVSMANATKKNEKKIFFNKHHMLVIS